MKYKIRLIILILFTFLSLNINYEKDIIEIKSKEVFEENYYEGDFQDDFSNESIETTLISHQKRVNEETSYQAIIEDDANLFNGDDYEKLLDEMYKITEYGNVMMKTIGSNEYSNGLTFAEKYYHTVFGQKVSGTIFLIDMSTRQLCIFSDGEVYETITSTYANIITDNIYKYASRGDYYGCAKEAFTEINTLLEGKKIRKPMKYISNTILAAVLATLIGFFYTLIKSSPAKTTLKEHVKSIKKQIEIDGPIKATKTGQRRVYDPPSSSGGSSGGGSSGGGGGGGSSGGGGSHGF